MSKPSQAVRRSRQRAIERIISRSGICYVQKVGPNLYSVIAIRTGKMIQAPTTKQAAWEVAIRAERYSGGAS